jgi:phosphoribosylformimino-5-aminoimidazole carboxamide ribotide isomerase
MLIPSIDLLGGRVVQLVQGRLPALAFDEVSDWVGQFQGFRRVQLIDLDGALATGTNETIARQICGRLACRVGGGVRDVARARQWLEAGATEVIVGSALFGPAGVDFRFASALAAEVGPGRVIAAIDSLGGKVVVHGWQEQTALSPEEAARQLEPYCGEFLYTHVDTEGLMGGIDMAAVHRVREATTRHISAAGGITTTREVDELDALGIDAVVGMAIYTGRMTLPALRER